MNDEEAPSSELVLVLVKDHGWEDCYTGIRVLATDDGRVGLAISSVDHGLRILDQIRECLMREEPWEPHLRTETP